MIFVKVIVLSYLFLLAESNTKDYLDTFLKHHELGETFIDLDDRLTSALSVCEKDTPIKDSSFLSPSQIEIYSEMGSLTTFLRNDIIENVGEISLKQFLGFTQTNANTKLPALYKYFEIMAGSVYKAFTNPNSISDSTLLEWAKRIVNTILKDKDYPQKWKFILIASSQLDLIRGKETNGTLVDEIEKVIQYIHSKLPTKTYVAVLKNARNTLWKKYAHNYEFCRFATMDWFGNETMSVMKWNELEFNTTRQYNNQLFSVQFIDLIDNFIPIDFNGKLDLSVMSVDCRHLSERGISTLSTALWNNLISNWKHSNSWKPLVKSLNCPTPSCPYLRTKETKFLCGFGERSFKEIESTAQFLLTIFELLVVAFLYCLVWLFLLIVVKNRTDLFNIYRFRRK